MKEMDIINSVVEERGLTAEEVVKNWLAQGIIHPDLSAKEGLESMQNALANEISEPDHKRDMDVINSVVEDWGLTAEDVVKNWIPRLTVETVVKTGIAQGIISPNLLAKEGLELKQIVLPEEIMKPKQKPFAEINFIPSKKFITPKTVEPGMFCYADGLISPELIKDNQVSAIVGFAEKNHGLAIGLRNTMLPWSSDLLFADLPLGINGQEATKLILQEAQRQGKKAEAAEWCAAYAFDGIEAGTMFLPSKEELQKFSIGYSKLRDSFFRLVLNNLHKEQTYYIEYSKLGDSFFPLEMDDLYNEQSCYRLSSSEGKLKKFMYVVDLFDGHAYGYAGKDVMHPVCCALAF